MVDISAENPGSDNPVTDNPTRHRFELAQDGLIAFATYRREPGLWFIDYVEAPVALRGTGVAGRLMHGVLDQARTAGVKVAPVCGYARAFMQRHRQYADLLA